MKLSTKFNSKLLGNQDKNEKLENFIVLVFCMSLSSYNRTLWGIYQKILIERLLKNRHKSQTNSHLATRQAERNQGPMYPKKEQKAAYSFMQQKFIGHHLYARHLTRHR